jgi:hypothetical protein
MATVQIPFHQSLVALIGPVVSEEKIKVYDVQWTDAKSSHGFWPGELIREITQKWVMGFT